MGRFTLPYVMIEKIQPATLIPSLTTSVCKITVRQVQRIACLACQRGAKRGQETQKVKKEWRVER